jgi:hypothetical protein
MRLVIHARQVVVAMLIGLGTPGCASAVPGTGPAPVDSVVKSGQWGGQHIAMTVVASGTDIEFDCGKASVSGTIETDRDGAFAAAGTFQPERPGPTRPDGPPPRPMRLSGTVKDDTMQVTVVLTDQNEEVGTFTLSFGAAPRLIKCR